MTAARLAAARAGDVVIGIGRGPIELRVEDRLQSLALPIRNMSAAMIGVLAGSLLAHAVLVTMAFVSSREPPPPAAREISVEVVREMPKPTPVAPKPPEKKAAAAPAPKPEANEKPAQPVPVAQGRPEPPKPAPAPKVETPKPDAGEIKALQAELAQLRAEQAALKTQATPVQSPPSQPAVAGSGMAKALPSIGLGADDVVGYQELVFSQLARAKGDGDYRGQAGVAGIKFEIDASGALLRAEVAATSGNPTLDAQALDIVHRAAPFPPPPTDADRVVYANVNFVPPKRR